MTENETISAAQKSDINAIKTIYDNHYGRLMGICIRYSKNEPEAAKMFDAGFSRVIKNLKAFQSSETFEQWINKQIIEVCVAAVRSKRNEYRVVSTVHILEKEQIKTLKISDEEILELLTADFLIKSLQKLNPSYRAIYNLYAIDGYTLAEIATLLEISEETARIDFDKALFNLKKQIKTLSQSHVE